MKLYDIMEADVLIIEDVKEMSDLVAMYLGKEGMTVKSAESAEEALLLLENYSPDIVILDLNLPGMDGFEFLHQFRKTSNIPVIIVSARDADEDIISGLGYGADEFVTKPFSPRVLTARIIAILRRTQDSSEKESSTEELKFGPYILNCESCILRKKKQDDTFERISLSAKEFSVLEVLIKNKGKPLTPELIYKQAWGDAYGDLSAVAVYIQRLRKKIEKDSANPVFIETIFGMGYRFND